MKKLLLFSFVTVASLYAGGKLVEPPIVPPVPVVVDEWTAPYIGVQAGYIQGKGTINITSSNKLLVAPQIANYDPFTLKPSGFIGGIFAGYNQKLSGDIVAGIDGAINYTNIKKTKSPLSINGDNIENESFTLKQKWDVALYGRLGVLVGQEKSLMPYVLAGVTGTKLYGGLTRNSTTLWKSKNLTGWTVGAGLEYKMNKNWHVRVQYRYSDYGSATFNYNTQPAFSAKVKKYKTNSVMVGLSYHFK